MKNVRWKGGKKLLRRTAVHYYYHPYAKTEMHTEKRDAKTESRTTHVKHQLLPQRVLAGMAGGVHVRLKELQNKRGWEKKSSMSFAFWTWLSACHVAKRSNVPVIFFSFLFFWCEKIEQRKKTSGRPQHLCMCRAFKRRQKRDPGLFVVPLLSFFHSFFLSLFSPTHLQKQLEASPGLCATVR